MIHSGDFGQNERKNIMPSLFIANENAIGNNSNSKMFLSHSCRVQAKIGQTPMRPDLNPHIKKLSRLSLLPYFYDEPEMSACRHILVVA